MLTKNKRGVSEIVVTIIIILLAIVVFAVVSVVIRGTVARGAENIELSANCLEVEMHAVKIAPKIGGPGIPISGSYDFTISRSSSGKEVDGVKLIIEDAEKENSKNSDNIPDTIQPLDKNTYTVSGITFTPAQVTVVPFFTKESGEVHYCENKQPDKLAVSSLVVSPSLVGYWNLESDTASVKDLSENGNNGTRNGAVKSSFDGVDDYIGVPAFSNPTSLNDFTISQWVKLSSGSNPRYYILDLRGDGSTTANSAGVFIDGTDEINVFLQYATSDYSEYGFTDSSSLVGRWVHVVAQREGINTKMYVNGNSVSLNLVQGVATKSNAMSLGNDKRIGTASAAGTGTYTGKTDFFFKGSIDEVMIFNKALSSTEVSEIYNIGLDKFGG